MKRIALIRNSQPLDFGGAEIFPVNLGKLLATNGYEPILVSAHAKTLATAKDANIKTARSPWWSFQNFSGSRICLFPVYVLWQIYLCVWYLVWGVKNKIYVFHPQSRDDFIATTFAAKLLGKQVVWTDHADLKYIYANHGVWYKNPVGKLVYVASLLANHVTLESMSEKRLVEVSLGRALPKNYSVIYIGVVDSYQEAKRKEKDKLTLVSTSRLVRAKGIGELIEAFISIQPKNAVLKICGDGPDAAHFKSLAADTTNIEFLGHVDDVMGVLSSADIFVHPSYHEGFGLSLVEAEMYSLPIIACTVGSIPEIVENGVSGILIPPKNAQELASAIRTLVGNPSLREEMGRAGRQIFLKKFQFDRIVTEKFLPLYEN